LLAGGKTFGVPFEKTESRLEPPQDSELLPAQGAVQELSMTLLAPLVMAFPQ
jgi:hypothetical protein